MKTILILGAGRSSSSLIQYLLGHSGKEGWKIIVTDSDLQSARNKTQDHTSAIALALDASDTAERKKLISKSDLVISMLPATMHADIAQDCIEFSKHLITPSYVSEQMSALDEQARKKGVLLLNEMGVDPGIDHMSAMKIMDNIRSNGGELLSFESFTGGLIAPESDNNPWNYKITWNPRNVVLAGSGGLARYLWNGEMRFIPYHKLFTRITEVDIPGYGKFEGYANRDSLSYRKIYGIEKIPSIFRGTLRRTGFCKAWNALVQLGLTDDSVAIPDLEKMTWKQFTLSFADIAKSEDVNQKLKEYLGTDQESIDKIKWLGLLDEHPTGLSTRSAAAAIQHLIEKKWQLSPGDKDMIVMWHRFRFRSENNVHEIQSSLVTKGEDEMYTAMAKTVGLPIAIAAKLILRGQITLTGVQLPVVPMIYDPVLAELDKLGITFTEKTTQVPS